MTTKLMIVQWSGPLPDWTDRWIANTQRITDAGHGWHFLLDHHNGSIRRRIESLGVTCPPLEGRKLCDYRPALGEMYAAEVAGFDFWGHTDLDCVYGPLWEYVTDELLAGCDVFSNDAAPNMCGPFSLYRTATASQVFRQHDGWESAFEDPEHHAFDETGIAPTLERAEGLLVTHRHWEGEDSMYVHFFRPKIYPDIQGWPWSPLAGTCRRGHERSQHSYINAAGAIRCRACIRAQDQRCRDAGYGRAVCAECGRDFTIRDKRGQTYCSQSCAYQARSTAMIKNGADHGNWKGETATYRALHAWLNRNHPRLGRCAKCGTEGRTHYAFRHHPQPYTRVRDDYVELCPSCHRRFDEALAAAVEQRVEVVA